MLRLFERKIVGKVYGPIMETGESRCFRNAKTDEILQQENIVRFTKARRISWLVRVETPSTY